MELRQVEPLAPKVAVVAPNTLAAVGLKHLLQTLLPVITVDTYGTLTELQANQPDGYAHYFAAMSIVLEHRQFFDQHHRKTIVLNPRRDNATQPQGFHTLCTNVSEAELVRSLLALLHHAHPGGRHLPKMPTETQQEVLSNREIQVMALIVQGYINKEIANKLNIGLATVVTHRKNIMEKLGLRSISALTIYAVTRGYVDIDKI